MTGQPSPAARPSSIAASSACSGSRVTCRSPTPTSRSRSAGPPSRSSDPRSLGSKLTSRAAKCSCDERCAVKRQGARRSCSWSTLSTTAATIETRRSASFCPAPPSASAIPIAFMAWPTPPERAVRSERSIEMREMRSWSKTTLDARALDGSGATSDHSHSCGWSLPSAAPSSSPSSSPAPSAKWSTSRSRVSSIHSASGSTCTSRWVTLLVHAHHRRLGRGPPRVALPHRAEHDGEGRVHRLIVELQLEQRERERLERALGRTRVHVAVVRVPVPKHGVHVPRRRRAARDGAQRDVGGPLRRRRRAGGGARGKVAPAHGAAGAARDGRLRHELLEHDNPRRLDHPAGVPPEGQQPAQRARVAGQAEGRQGQLRGVVHLLRALRVLEAAEADRAVLEVLEGEVQQLLRQRVDQRDARLGHVEP
eukprot:scaffold90212_cov43-Phaeocystis_antarctica.AAC.2